MGEFRRAMAACEGHEAVWSEGLVVTSDVRGLLMKQSRWLNSTRAGRPLFKMSSIMVAPPTPQV